MHKGHCEVKIKDCCIYGGNVGYILHSQKFQHTSDIEWYWVIMPEINKNVGFWFKTDCLDVTSGQLPIHDHKTAKRCSVEKDSTLAYLTIDRNTIDIMRKHGYTIKPA